MAKCQDCQVAKLPAAAISLAMGGWLATAGGAQERQNPVTFSDISQSAGVVFRHNNGASPEKHFEETMGSGGLFFDFDGDGWVDIFLVDGGSIADPAVAAKAGHRLGAVEHQLCVRGDRPRWRSRPIRLQLRRPTEPVTRPATPRPPRLAH